MEELRAPKKARRAGAGAAAAPPRAARRAGPPGRRRDRARLARRAAAAAQVAFGAYAEPRKQAEKIKSNAFKIALVASDCLLLGLQPVLVHLSKNESGKFSFNPISVNLMTEIFKVASALGVLLVLVRGTARGAGAAGGAAHSAQRRRAPRTPPRRRAAPQGTGRPGPPMYRSLRAFVADARHNWLLAVPAGLYAVNNYLKFAMQLYFRPVTTKMLGNLKIFTIALLMRTVMRRRFSVIQYEALFLLVAGITINQLQSCGNKAEALPPGALLPAVLCVLGSVTVPSAASVYNEKGLKKHMDTSVHLQNFFLYFFGMCFNLAGALVVCAVKRQSLGAVFAHQSRVTFVLAVNNGLQGIVSSFFYKFADTILKKYSSTIATIFTAALSWAMFGHALTANFLIGVSIVFVSMHQFFTFGDKGDKAAAGAHKHSDSGGAGPGGARGGGGMVYSPSMDHIRVNDENGVLLARNAMAALDAAAVDRLLASMRVEPPGNFGPDERRKLLAQALWVVQGLAGKRDRQRQALAAAAAAATLDPRDLAAAEMDHPEIRAGWDAKDAFSIQEQLFLSSGEHGALQRSHEHPWLALRTALYSVVAEVPPSGFVRVVIKDSDPESPAAWGGTLDLLGARRAPDGTPLLLEARHVLLPAGAFSETQAEHLEGSRSCRQLVLKVAAPTIQLLAALLAANARALAPAYAADIKASWCAHLQATGMEPSFLLPLAPLDQDVKLPRACSACGKTGSVKACTGCLVAGVGQRFYCSSTCQKQDWPAHRAACKAAKAAAGGGGGGGGGGASVVVDLRADSGLPYSFAMPLTAGTQRAGAEMQRTMDASVAQASGHTGSSRV
ncbi:CMP-sialic acid transporter 2 [Scenedesmus sp. PABB004]|nr:CMP-sialic acid transporter 2 [Scenedesmus sp. PABB004]